jgi:2-keto-4-pentenoate hydratase
MIAEKREETAMEDTAAQRAAETLLAAHKAGTQFQPLAGLAAIGDSYDVQDRYVALLRAAHGDPVGYKVGLTSKAMQTFVGVDHPIAGVVLAKRVHQSGASVRRADYGRLGLEFEIAVRMKSDMPASADTPASVAPYIGGVTAAIEIVDDRAADYGNLDIKTLVADNSWNAGFVFPSFLPEWPELEPLLGKATKDGASVGEGYGRDILGHPFNSVAWLNAQLVSRGGALRKGDIVTTGSVMKTVFPTEAAHYRFGMPGLGSVELKVI